MTSPGLPPSLPDGYGWVAAVAVIIAALTQPAIKVIKMLTDTAAKKSSREEKLLARMDTELRERASMAEKRYTDIFEKYQEALGESKFTKSMMERFQIGYDECIAREAETMKRVSELETKVAVMEAVHNQNGSIP